MNNFTKAVMMALLGLAVVGTDVAAMDRFTRRVNYNAARATALNADALRRGVTASQAASYVEVDTNGEEFAADQEQVRQELARRAQDEAEEKAARKAARRAAKTEALEAEIAEEQAALAQLEAADAQEEVKEEVKAADVKVAAEAPLAPWYNRAYNFGYNGVSKVVKLGYNVVKTPVVGTYNAVTNPRATAQSIGNGLKKAGNAVLSPRETYRAYKAAQQMAKTDKWAQEAVKGKRTRKLTGYVKNAAQAQAIFGADAQMSKTQKAKNFGKKLYSYAPDMNRRRAGYTAGTVVLTGLAIAQSAPVAACVFGAAALTGAYKAIKAKNS